MLMSAKAATLRRQSKPDGDRPCKLQRAAGVVLVVVLTTAWGRCSRCFYRCSTTDGLCAAANNCGTDEQPGASAKPPVSWPQRRVGSIRHKRQSQAVSPWFIRVSADSNKRLYWTCEVV